ncbi:MAG: Fe(3+) ABC transporter substrate-binding protein [Polycyclovorans sp.]|nr:Fe(3+) ABC transporter substrate-binding protein [Polycyclovorans sp.]|tara:strand:- start:3627 stop:4643 length:1017 start_codon:yes stop_codon:yes gene_type:complete
MQRSLLRTLSLTLLALAPALALAAEPPTLVVYSARAQQLIEPLFARYTAETGVEIKVLSDSEGALMQRLQAEGKASPADLLITVDAGNLWQAAERNLLQATDSAVLAKNIPAHLRDPDNRWFGLSVRARTLVYASDRVDADALSTYEALGDDTWKGRLCLRTSQKVYNQSLVAMMIAQQGREATEVTLRGWIDNLAAAPFANDTQVMEAILAGQCDVGIVNTYYFGRLQSENPDLPLKLFFPNQGEGERGVHVNVSGAGITRHAPHPEAAQALLEWLSADDAQALFASLNQEYPANPDVPMDPQVAAWGRFRQDLINVSEAGRRQVEAVTLMDRVGYR